MATEGISYDRRELRAITSAFKAMSEQAIDEAKKQSSALAEYAAAKIKDAAATRSVSPIAAQRIASGVKISKSSKIGEFSYGFASQKFSGGGTTRDLLTGMEFGSRKFKQFPMRSPILGRGNAGYFIYPTLRAIQPEIVQQWEESFDRILKEYN
jgi:hypothetical protein